MRVLLYDHDRQRNKNLHLHLEDDDIPVMAAYCLKDFLMKIEKPSLKILLIEHSRIQHYNIDVENLLERLGLTFIVFVYTDTGAHFEFNIYYVHTYFYYPFTTDKDKELMKKVKQSLQKFKNLKEEKTHHDIPVITKASSAHKNKITHLIKQFSDKQKKLIEKLLEKKEGINIDEIITILDADDVKDKQNYAQSHIHRLRNKLAQITGKEYIISYKNHTYQLLHIQSELQ